MLSRSVKVVASVGRVACRQNAVRGLALKANKKAQKKTSFARSVSGKYNLTVDIGRIERSFGYRFSIRFRKKLQNALFCGE